MAGQEGNEDHKLQQPEAERADERVTVTARLIRSFPHRNLRHLVLRDVELGLSGAEFLRLCRDEAARPQSGLPPPFRTFEYDCCKVSCNFWIVEPSFSKVTFSMLHSRVTSD